MQAMLAGQLEAARSHFHVLSMLQGLEEILDRVFGVSMTQLPLAPGMILLWVMFTDVGNIEWAYMSHEDACRRDLGRQHCEAVARARDRWSPGSHLP